MNVPNRLTVLRVAMIPLFVVAMLWHQLPYSDYIAAVLFIGACITDFLDGYIARKHNLITTFGKFMDPLADKLLCVRRPNLLFGRGQSRDACMGRNYHYQPGVYYQWLPSGGSRKRSDDCGKLLGKS